MAEQQSVAAESSARYLVSARKYRPQTFGDLVAQEHVTATLRNAIRFDRLAHAYLFSGPRGVGKTTAARLLAKAINCQTPLEEREDAEPCRTCDACRSFEEGRDLNVIEIDAASNRKIEDVRDLRETIRIPPQGARKKVYILDEIHMLTKEAFNALLKTLEEPPDHALFIFATTEPHKVLPTILSRCQRFDFRRIPIEQTVSHLRDIAEQEGIAADEAAFHLVARRADGALRDALSLFDQAVALCGREISYDNLAHQLGVVDRDLFFVASDAASNGDSAALLKLVGDIVARGYDLAEFLGGLVEHLRHLYVVATTGAAELIEADDATRKRYLEAGRDRAEADLLRAMIVVEEAEQRLKASPQPRLTAELALLRLAHLAPVTEIRSLISRLEEGAGNDASRSAPSNPAPRQSSKPAVPEAAAAAEPAQRYDQDRDEGGPKRPPSDGPMGGSEPPPRPAPPKPTPSAPAVNPAPRPATKAADEVFGRPALQRPRPANGGGPQAQAVAMPKVADEHFGPALSRMRDAWSRVLETVAVTSTSVATILAQAHPAGTRGGAVRITVPDDFSKTVLQHEQELFANALRDVLGHEAPAFVVEVDRNGQETASDDDPFETIKRLRHEHPTLRFLFERFGAEIVWS